MLIQLQRQHLVKNHDGPSIAVRLPRILRRKPCVEIYKTFPIHVVIASLLLLHLFRSALSHLYPRPTLLLCYGSVSLPGMVGNVWMLFFQFLSQSRQDFVPYVVLVSVCELRYFVHCPPCGTIFQNVDGHFFGRDFLLRACNFFFGGCILWFQTCNL